MTTTTLPRKEAKPLEPVDDKGPGEAKDGGPHQGRPPAREPGRPRERRGGDRQGEDGPPRGPPFAPRHLGPACGAEEPGRHHRRTGDEPRA